MYGCESFALDKLAPSPASFGIFKPKEVEGKKTEEPQNKFPLAQFQLQ